MFIKSDILFGHINLGEAPYLDLKMCKEGDDQICKRVAIHLLYIE